ncbi:MAG: phosphoribosylformylglycinamidine synthase subunit PurS [Chloracidobacterium sp.]|nr:phosphoribosylformylglycinamidine synthase subunit PurS [Chloracidobacterium sp.]MCC6824720.1 phosphoribosylformylglycinamidine synthase subunit PurS [Acidobacteriota bacterium]MCO5332739.1 phosphoribosylformylglycinamidine synthase subunit PurS [Pyrinomonadaceae bacterium]
MKARVYVTLKQGVLDPQGKAILHSVELLGHKGLADARQGKYFELEFDDTMSADEIGDAAEAISRDMLANPIIEDYRVEMDQ